MKASLAKQGSWLAALVILLIGSWASANQKTVIKTTQCAVSNSQAGNGPGSLGLAVQGFNGVDEDYNPVTEEFDTLARRCTEIINFQAGLTVKIDDASTFEFNFPDTDENGDGYSLVIDGNGGKLQANNIYTNNPLKCPLMFNTLKPVLIKNMTLEIALCEQAACGNNVKFENVKIDSTHYQGQYDQNPDLDSVCNNSDNWTGDNCPNVSNSNQKDQDGDGKGDACDNSDGDALLDDKDNCPNVTNPTQTDTDKDGKGDACDTDIDGDNIPNHSDNCPLVANADQADTDKPVKDGWGNKCDNCPMISNPNQDDIDGNGVGDICEVAIALDYDGDGFNNSEDNCPSIFNPNQADGDKDKVGDVCDNCPNLSNADQKDTDGNKVGDACEDSDNDGVSNLVDNCFGDPNPEQEDFNGNGIGDACEDSDGDEIKDSLDNCREVFNPAQDDYDTDNQGDLCDDDSDGDGHNNDADNCPETPNSDQLDSNQNSIGDACDVNQSTGGDESTGGDGSPTPEDQDPASTGCSLGGGQSLGIFGPVLLASLLSGLHFRRKRS